MKLLGIIISFVLLTNVAFASSMFKCPSGNVVHAGDSKGMVKIKCGKPVASDYGGLEKVRDEYVYIYRWIYPKGNKYRTLEFHDGLLKKIY